MLKYLVPMLIFLSSAFADVGVILKVNGKDARIERGTKKLSPGPAVKLRDGDLLLTNQSRLELTTKGKLRVNLEPATTLKLLSGKPHFGQLLSGNLTVTGPATAKAPQAILADTVTFSSPRAGFSLELTEKLINLSVTQGEVTVASPDIHTLVPEVVKAGEKFYFDRGDRSFGRRN